MFLLLLALACAPKHEAAPPPSNEQIVRMAWEAARTAPGGPALTISPEARAEDILLPMGVWLDIAGNPMFTYLDPEAGPSMGGMLTTPELTTRLVTRVGWRPPHARALTAEQVAAAGLSTPPEWLDAYGPQPATGSLWGSWRMDPRLNGRFHSVEYPDDLQLIVIGPAKRGLALEVFWVRIVACEADSCQGVLLNVPTDLTDLQEGQILRFPITVGPDDPLVLTL